LINSIRGLFRPLIPLELLLFACPKRSSEEKGHPQEFSPEVQGRLFVSAKSGPAELTPHNMWGSDSPRSFKPIFPHKKPKILRGKFYIRNLKMNEEDLKLGLKSFYTAICEMVDFIEQVMLPQIKAVEKLCSVSNKKLPKKDAILIALYMRVYLWVKTVKALGDTIYFQAIASAARSIFDILVDIKLLIDDNPPEAAERIDAFIEIEKFRLASEYLLFKKNNPKLKYIGDSAKEAFVNKPGQAERVKNLRERYWLKANGRIEHWSGFGTKKRCEIAGKKYELLYYESFKLWSWYVHPAGLTGFKLLSPDGYKAIFGRALDRILDLTCDITELIARHLKLIEGMPEFDNWMEKIRAVPGRVMIENIGSPVKNTR